MTKKRTLFIECTDIVMLEEQTRDELLDLFIHQDSSLSAKELSDKVEEYILSYPHKIKCSSTFDSLINELKTKYNVVLFDVTRSDAQYSHLKYLAKHYNIDFLSLTSEEVKQGKRFDFRNGYVVCSHLSSVFGSEYSKLYYMRTSLYRRVHSYLYKNVIPVRSWSSLLRKLKVW